MSIVAHDRPNGQSHGALPLHLLPTPPAVSDTREDAGVDEQEAALPAPAATKPKDRLADGLTAVVAGSAAFSSWTGWVLLGHHAMWPRQGMPFGWTFDTAWLNPISVDVLAYLGMRAWVSRDSSPEAKAWGRGAAVGALSLSIVGNALGHALESNPDLVPTLPLVIGLAAIAPIILVVVLHLRTLRNTPRESGGGDPPPEDTLPADPPAVETPSGQVGGTLPAAPAAPQIEPPPVLDQVHDSTSEEEPPTEEQEEPSPEPEVEPTQETPQVPNGKPGDAELIEAIRNLDAKYGRRTGVDRIKTDLSIGTGRASRLRKDADKPRQS